MEEFKNTAYVSKIPSKRLMDVRNCSYTSGITEYFVDTVKKSTLLDEMVRVVRTEALRIEAARHGAKRLLQRRQAELVECGAQELKSKRVSRHGTTWALVAKNHGE